MKIIYAETGIATGDFSRDVWEERLVTYKDYDNTYHVSNELVINVARLLIAKGELDHEKVMFEFEGKVFYANRYGAILNWPTGFCDTNLRLSEEILTHAMRKRYEQKD